ncbi:MAG TPA: electron transport complex subunit RsxE [Bacteroidales bacterium]|nr:MAG: electron transport complex subunit RsxE [Bacteroidetes bacterium GWE2_42_24]OFY29504.1 MAG: electron transport complex subunit RsxE [Bacteroidetes bacterium GWF2_43_11]HAQ64704.1 electron transport complex subunit RsxE [Bacteroidales bacterium]HBZ67300.1 electron transport complex subunit RsxE [Bacteroidales bacterium]
MSNLKFFTNGLIKENPTFVLVLGTCPTLAVTTAAMNGLGMGAATTFVLVFSNVLIAMLKNFIPDKVRIAAFIVVIATFVTIVDLVMKAFTPDLYKTLGIFIPLIVVNCIILGRAEAFAQKNKVFPALLDGLGMGLGFTLAITLLASVRELLGNGSVFDISLVSENAKTILIFILPPGAFITYGYMIAVVNRLKAKYNL